MSKEQTSMQMQEQESQHKGLLTIDDYEFVCRKNETYETIKSFKGNTKNRILMDSALESKLKQLLDKENHKWGQLDPIQVNVVTNTMTDGHARWTLFMKSVEEGWIPITTKIPVEYIKLDPSLERQYLWQKQYCRSWTGDDFISSYLNDENKNYIDIDTFCRNHFLCIKSKDKNGNIKKLNYRLGAALLCGVRKGIPLKTGEFKFPYENIISAEITHNELVEIYKAIGLDFGAGAVECMCTAWIKVKDMYKQFTFNDWKSILKLKKYRGGPQSVKAVNETMWINFFKLAASDILEKKNKQMESETK